MPEEIQKPLLYVMIRKFNASGVRYCYQYENGEPSPDLHNTWIDLMVLLRGRQQEYRIELVFT